MQGRMNEAILFGFGGNDPALIIRVQNLFYYF